MTLLSPTPLLLLCLLAATRLGAGIGACLWHLRLERRHARDLRRVRDGAAREREALEAVAARERESASLKHEQQSRRVRQEHERAERALARQEALVAGTRERDRRIEVLEAEVLGLEERLARARVETSPGGAGRPTVSRVGEDRLPVLKRRVGRASPPSPASGVASGSLGTFGDDLEIPPLSESELPDTVDELALELLGADEPDRPPDG